MQSFSVYQTKQFARFARRARLTDGDLWQAAQRANDGLIDADLGGGVIKQRIARSGEGKSGGSRTILLFRKRDRAVFVDGFQKKDQANLSLSDLQRYRAFAKYIFALSEAALQESVRTGVLVEMDAPKGDEHAD
jgi:hypothetical protein